MTSFRHRLFSLAFAGFTAIVYAPCTAADENPAPTHDAPERVLTVVQDPAWAPFAYTDDTGIPRGLLVDLWEALGEKLGRPVQFKLVDWQQTLDQVRDNPGHIHGGLFRSAERATYLDFSDELLPLRTALFVAARDHLATVLEVRDLGDAAVGITAGGYEETFMRDNHPGISLRRYGNNERMIQAAVAGDIHAFVADYPVGMYYLDRHTTPERFRVLTVLYRQPLVAAVAKGNPDLLASVNTALAELGPAQKSRIVQKWIRTEHVEILPAWLVPSLAVTAGAMLLGWLTLHNWLLRRRVSGQTHALVERERRLSLLTDNITDVVWSVDADHRYSYVSPSVQGLTGYRPGELVGRRTGRTISPETTEMLAQQIRQARDKAFRDGPTDHADFTVEAELRRRDGSPVWTEVASRVFFDFHGRFAGMQGVAREITERRRSQETIKRLAYFDSLTKLPNRRLLMDRLAEARALCARNREFGALLFLDLDNFKLLNDTQGHDTGDRLLQQVAERLVGAVRDSDTVARLGGDEFVVVLTGMGQRREEAERNTEQVGLEILAAISRPCELGGRHLHTSPSIGATLFHDPDQPPENLLKQADLAMYEAKIAGRRRLCFYDPRMQAAVDARANRERDLRGAIDDGQFSLLYQPQVDGDGHITGAEALLRWHHPIEGVIEPGAFIGLAEETALIGPIGDWVLASAARQLARWAQNPDTRTLTLSVNVSARQFDHPDFVEEVLAMLDGSGADPRRLKLELTESAVLRDVDASITKMARLREHGVGFALDDFGTGYSSLSYLKRLPLDQLKIDKSFVHHVLTDENDTAIAHTIIALGRVVDLPVIAEGVETPEQHLFLAEHGCQAFQGFLFGAPEPIQSFNARVRADSLRRD